MYRHYLYYIQWLFYSVFGYFNSRPMNGHVDKQQIHIIHVELSMLQVDDLQDWTQIPTLKLLFSCLRRWVSDCSRRLSSKALLNSTSTLLAFSWRKQNTQWLNAMFSNFHKITFHFKPQNKISDSIKEFASTRSFFSSEHSQMQSSYDPCHTSLPIPTLMCQTINWFFSYQGQCAIGL